MKIALCAAGGEEVRDSAAWVASKSTRERQVVSFRKVHHDQAVVPRHNSPVCGRCLINFLLAMMADQSDVQRSNLLWFGARSVNSETLAWNRLCRKEDEKSRRTRNLQFRHKGTISRYTQYKDTSSYFYPYILVQARTFQPFRGLSTYHSEVS